MRKPIPQAIFRRWTAMVVLGVAAIYFNHADYQVDSMAPFAKKLEAFALAASLIKTHTFSDPFWVLPTGPSAHMAPLYPVYLALIAKLSAQEEPEVRTLNTTLTFILALQAMMLPELARRLGLGFWTGVVAALAWIGAGTRPTIASEATLAGVLILAAAMMMHAAFVDELSVMRLLIVGLVWGSLLLLQPVVMPVFLVWVLLLHLRSKRSRRQKMTLLLVPMIIVSPWIFRNFLVFHKVVFVRDNLGIELAVSNNPCARYSMDLNFRTGCHAGTHPNQSYEEAVRARDLGEVVYNQVRLREAMQWVRGNPASFLHLSIQRFHAFWLPERSANSLQGALLQPWLLHLFTLASAPGLFAMWKNARTSVYIVGSWLMFFPPVYYFVQYSVRYRYPILWATFLPGSYLIVESARALRRRVVVSC